MRARCASRAYARPRLPAVLKRALREEDLKRPFMEEMERRLLLSADAFGAFAGNAVYQDVEQPDDESIQLVESEQAAQLDIAEHQSNELVIVDAATPDYQSLLADLTGGANSDRTFDIAIIDSSEDGIARISELLSDYSDLDAVHIISHGDDGRLALGNSVLDYDALIDNARDIEYWGDAFGEEGDLLVYGCNLAATDQGQDLVDALSRLTETDVAASEDLTGADSLGGDWDLEYRVGQVDVDVAISLHAQQSWQATLQMQTGSYVGDGTDARGITGLGFQPDFIIIKSESAAYSTVVRTSSMTGDATKALVGGLPIFADGIESLDADGFTVGTDGRVNAGGETYHWTAFSAAAGEMVVGSYTGDGTDDRSVSGFGLQADYAIVMGEGAHESVQRFQDQVGDTSLEVGSSAVLTNVIQAFEADGLQIGSDVRVNQSGQEYFYVAWKEVAGKTDFGTYAGDGTDDRSISGVGFQPDYVLVKIEGGGDAIHHPDSLTGDNSLGTGTDGTFADGVQQFTADGFEVGSHITVNWSGQTYYYAAFNAETAPTVADNFDDGAGGSTAYAGNDGTQNWIGDWVETNDTANRIDVVDVLGGGDWRLKVQGDSGAQNYWVSRQVDLSGSTTATLTYDFELVNHWDAGFVVEIRDGDSGWTQVKSYSASGSRSGSESIDIAANLRDNGLTEIRFRSVYYTDPDIWYIDNIQIAHDGAGSNAAPVITSDGGGDAAAINVAENATSVTTVIASDGDGDQIEYTISGGADAALFDIDRNTGVLIFLSSPDYETPLDANGDNVYEVVVMADDQISTSDTQAISVTVTNVAEFLVSNTNDSGVGSLRQAIIDANAAANAGSPDFIIFDIAGVGPHTITLSSALPGITEAVHIDGSSEPDFGGTPVIEINGNSVNASGLTLAAGSDGSTIQGLIINNFDNDSIRVESGNHTIIGNYLGVNAAGTAVSGSSFNGINVIGGADNITIGGTGAGEGNVIGGATQRGIEIWGTSTNVTIQGNYIGTDITGTIDLGNGWEGIHFGGGVTNSLIGGATAGAGNVVANNGIGIRVESTTSTGNSLLGNSIYDNNNLGIDLLGGTEDANDVTANDAGDGDTGANNLQNYPVLSSAATTGSQITINGSLNSTANSYYRIEFFASTTGDASGHGEAESYLGFANVATDGSGNATINAVLTASVSAGDVITATATKSDATYSTFTDTSEFAANINAATGASLWLTTEEDVGSPSGANGLDSWAGGSVLSFDDPNLALDPGGTDGNLSNVFNLDNFVQDGDSRLDAVHYVGTNMTVGSNAISLQAGDILLSSVFPETLVNSDTSTLSVTSRDVFIFRPDSAADYSLGGTFIKLINGADLAIEIEGITLVEQTTTVGVGGGSTTLNPGDFLFTDRDNDSTIYRLQPGVLGDGATNTGTITVLVDGTDIGINQTIHGVELVESDVTIGDRTLTSGQLLVSLYSDDVVAGTSVSRSDIFILNVTDTGTATTATAEALFTGGDIGLDTWQESPWAVSLVPAATNAVNDDPVLAGGINGSILEGGSGFAFFYTTGTVSDPDSTNFDGGTLTLSIASGGDGTETLYLATFDGVTTSGGNVFVSGIQVGSVTGGTGGTPLVITFNADATLARVETVFKNLAIIEGDDSATSGIRTLEAVLTDGDGGTSNSASVDVTINAVNDDPVLTIPPGTTAYTEGAYQLITPSATLTDADSADFDGGQLTVTISSGGEATDDMYIFTTGNILASGSNLSYDYGSGMVLIGSISGGNGAGDPLIVTFNSSATTAAIEDVVEAIFFRAVTDDPSTTSRVIDFQITDGDGGTSATQTRTIDVTAINDNPIVTNLDGDALNYTEGDGAVVVEEGGDVSVSDADSADFAGGSLNVEVGSGLQPAEDVFTIRNEGTGAGQIGVSGSNVTYGGVVIGSFVGGTGSTPLTVTFNSNANAAAVTALVQNVTYENVNTDDPTAGARSVTIDITDGDGGASLTQNVVINVTAANDAPTPMIVATDFGFNEDDSYRLLNTISVGDVDAGSAELSVTLSVSNGLINLTDTTGLTFTSGTNDSATMTFTGTLTDLNAALATVTYRPDANFAGTDVINLFVDDQGNTGGAPLTASDTANINVTAINDPPVVVMDATPALYLTDPVDIDPALSLSDVDDTHLESAQVYFGNGFQKGHDRLLFTDQSGITGSFSLSTGVLTLTGTATVAEYEAAIRSVQYEDANPTPAEGVLIVNVSVFDGEYTSNVANKEIHIVTDLPPRAGDDSGTVAEGGSVLIDLAVNDTDNENSLDLSSIVVTSGPSNGSVIINGDGTVTYTHDGSETLADTFTYTVQDTNGNTSSEAVVTITVTADNDSPAVLTNTGINVDEGSTGNVITAAMLNEGDPDDDGAEVTYTVASVTGNGTLNLSGAALAVNDTFTQADIDAGLVTYDHDGSENLSDSFAFSLSDGGEDGATTLTGQTFNIAVNGVNDAPLNSVPGGQNMLEDSSLVFSSGNGNLISISDVDAAGGTVAVRLTGTNGTITLSGTTGLSFTTGDGTSDADMIFIGTIADINAALDGLTFDADPDFAGVANLQVITNDSGNTGSGGPLEDTDNIAITVDPVDDAPVITSNGGGATSAVNVVENVTAVTTVVATDAENDSIVYSISGGADASKFTIDSVTGALSFVAAPDFENPTDVGLNNVYDVEVTATANGADDTQLISVTVTDVSHNLVVTTIADLSDGDVSSAEALNVSKGVDGAISLREAITAANNSTETVTISFNIGGGGPQTIAVGTAGLPIITDSVILDATTQPGYSGTPLITLDGSAVPAASGINGITIRADDSTVKGFIVINFPDEGIEIDGSTGFGDNNTIQNNWVGIDKDGNVAANTEHGIMISAGADGNQIGGAGLNEGNVVAGNGFSGVIINEDSNNNILEGNIIGLKADGMTVAGNGNHGVLISMSSDGNRIGGSVAGAGNVISGNSGDGIYIDGTTDATFTTAVTGTVILGNYIGTDATGNAQAGNDIQDTGITINESHGNTIGGTGAGDANVLSGNRLRGVVIIGATATDNVLSGNFIGTNADGSAALTNVGGGQQIGVYLYDTPGNTIGGTAAGAGNVISGNITYGIYAWGPNTSGNEIQGNTIGLDASRSTAIGNGNAGGSGILLSSASDNLVGGTVAGATNVISGHLGAGLIVSGASPTGNTVLGNEIYDNGALGIDLDSDGVTANDADDADAGANDLQNFPVITFAELNGTDLTLNGSLDTDGLATQYRIEFFGNAAGTEDATNGEARVYLGAVTVTTDGSGDATFSGITLSGITLTAGDFVTATATRIVDPAQVGIDDALAYGSTSEFAVNVVITDADTTAPVVTVDTISTSDNTPQLTGTIDDPTATVQVTVNGTTYAATNNGDGTWTLADDTITPALADGTYDVSVAATDGSSNVGNDASTNELTVDTTAPVVTVTGLITVDNTPALTGTVNDPSATVDVTVNGTTYAATNNGDGTWTLADDTIAPALADGTYDVSVTATDALGNAGTDGSTNELTVDTTAPIVTVTGLTTVDNTPQLTGTVNDPAATVDVTVNGTTYAATNNGDGTWTLADNTVAPALADGTYDVSVTATDALGNAGTDGSTNELTVDTTAPIVTVTGLSTVDNTPALTGTVNDPAATVDVTVNGTTYAATNNGDGTWTLADNTIAPALADGTYDVAVTATDALGNAGIDASTNELTVDTTAPIVTVTGLTTVDNTPALTGTVNDPAATIDVTVNGTTYAATNNGDGTWTLADNTIAPALADGTYDVSVTATDALGNAGIDASTNELTVDTTAPIVTVTGLTTVDSTPALTGTVNDPAATVDVTVNGTTYAATNNGDGTWTLADNTIAPALADGTYDVSVTATDALGNAGADGSTNELTIDTTAPIVTVTGLTTVDNTPALTGTVSDPTATVDVTVNGATYAATNNGDGTWTLADDTIAPALADGTYDVSVTATDALGNAGTDGSTNELTVDTTAPIVTVTGLSTVDNTPALTGTVNDPSATVGVTVNGTTYAATNNGDGTWTLADNTIAPALADGTYDVAVTATDALGNAGTDGVDE